MLMVFVGGGVEKGEAKYIDFEEVIKSGVYEGYRGKR